MNAIGNATQPVFINGKGVPSVCGAYPKGAAFLGTDANGNLIAKSAPTIPDQTPQEGDLISVNNRAVSVKNLIPDNYTGPIGINASRQLVAVAIEDHGLGPDSLGDYTEVVPYWGYSGSELVTPEPDSVVIAPGQYNKVACARIVDDTHEYYQYTVSIPTWDGGRSKMCSIDFCCKGGQDSSDDMKVWLVGGDKAVNILKQHPFNYAYKTTNAAEQTVLHFVNSYASCNLVIPLKSGVNLRFVSSNMVRHMQILLFNV